MPWLQLRFDCDTTTIRLRRIARACFHSTRFDASIKWTCQFFVVYCSRIVVESQLCYRLKTTPPLITAAAQWRSRTEVSSTANGSTQGSTEKNFAKKIYFNFSNIYTVAWSIKNKTPNYCPCLRHILTDFRNYFTDTLSRKFAIKISLQIPPQRNGVATLPCEILVYKNRINWKHSNGRRGVRIVKRMRPW